MFRENLIKATTEVEFSPDAKVMQTHKARNRMKTTLQTAMLNISFPDGLTGAISVTKVVNDPWKPRKDIKKIVIEWE